MILYKNGGSDMKKKVLVLIIMLYIVLTVVRFSYIPFSGNLFQIDSSEIHSIRIRSGSGDQVQLYEREELENVVDILNEMKYQYWIPILPIKKGGYAYIITIETNQGDFEQYEFNEKWFNYGNIMYHDSSETLERLIRILEESVKK